MASGRQTNSVSPHICVSDLLFLLGVQIPDQRVPLVDQDDQLVQQQLLSPLLGLRLLPVCNDTRGTNLQTRRLFTQKTLLIFPRGLGMLLYQVTETQDLILRRTTEDGRVINLQRGRVPCASVRMCAESKALQGHCHANVQPHGVVPRGKRCLLSPQSDSISGSRGANLMETLTEGNQQ